MARATPEQREVDEQRFAAVYPGLRRFAAAVAPPGVDADDLVQEVLARTLRRRRLAEIEHLGAYLRTAVLNQARNQRRSWARGVKAFARLGVAEDTADSYPSDLADLMRLPPEARAVLYLVEVEGASFADVAAVLGVSPEAARTRASRARSSLRDLLGPEFEILPEV